MRARLSPWTSRLQSSTGEPTAASSIAMTWWRTPVEIVSRGTHTNANKWRCRAEQTSTTLGRGRSTRLIIVVATRSRSAPEKAISKSWGRLVSAWISALPAWPVGAKSRFFMSPTRCWRRRGMRSGGAANAALVQIPAWTDSAVSLPSSTTGTMNKSSGTRRWTVEMVLDLTISGASPFAANRSKARS
jgi:hypothetical protein